MSSSRTKAPRAHIIEPPPADYDGSTSLPNCKSERIAQQICQTPEATGDELASACSVSRRTLCSVQALPWVQKRIAWLQARVADDAIGTAKERARRLTELYRNNRAFVDEKGNVRAIVEPAVQVKAIDVSNKMDGTYAALEQAKPDATAHPAYRAIEDFLAKHILPREQVTMEDWFEGLKIAMERKKKRANAKR